jgi:predicted nuclease of predicted toxin-antitoxin system
MRLRLSVSGSYLSPREVPGRQRPLPSFRSVLRDKGQDAVHVRDYDLHRAEDRVIFTRAADEGRVVVSADTGFGTLLAVQQTRRPSFILFRGPISRRPESLAELLSSHLPQIEGPLSLGAIVVIEPSRIRIRNLPIGRVDVNSDSI